MTTRSGLLGRLSRYSAVYAGRPGPGLTSWRAWLRRGGDQAQQGMLLARRGQGRGGSHGSPGRPGFSTLCQRLAGWEQARVANDRGAISVGLAAVDRARGCWTGLELKLEHAGQRRRASRARARGREGARCARCGRGLTSVKRAPEGINTAAAGRSGVSGSWRTARARRGGGQCLAVGSSGSWLCGRQARRGGRGSQRAGESEGGRVLPASALAFECSTLSFSSRAHEPTSPRALEHRQHPPPAPDMMHCDAPSALPPP